MNDREELLALLERYFDGLYLGDVELLRQAFHPQARLAGEVNGEVLLRDMTPYLHAVANRASPQARGEARRMQLLSLQIDGAIAQASARCEMLGFDYLDQLGLLKQDGRWSIVSKLYTHVAG